MRGSQIESDLGHRALVGGPQLATELMVSAEEFERYDVFDTPLTLSFHLREFNVCPRPPPLPCYIH